MIDVTVFDIGKFVNSPVKPMLTVKDSLSRAVGGFGSDGSIVVEIGESALPGPLCGENGPDGKRLADPTYQTAVVLRFPSMKVYDEFMWYLTYLKDEWRKKEAREAGEATRPVLRPPDDPRSRGLLG